MSRQAVDRQPRIPVPLAGLPRRSRDELLMAAHHGLDEASFARTPGQRYALAHLAALRAAAAVLVERARPRHGHRGRPVSVWQLLARVAPELAEWAQFFAAGAAKRTAAEAGLSVVGVRDADDLLRQAETFLAVAETTLGLPSQPALTATVVSCVPPVGVTCSPEKAGV
ncbi:MULTISPECIES: SAV_6107 family HEPN domain-containing protein [Protofrankia]|uniref:SAV_6107 family HEPN domain-containing protein n=1 Tax=Protofrankia TaxID=2994361 RepID=UPI0009768A7D|nr:MULTISPECIES: SAV_6107 family HEPN domain-containing protein [Protofrankia]